MRKTVLAVVILIVVAVLFLVFVAQHGGRGPKIVQVGDKAPGFSLPTLEGRMTSLAEYRGKVVMVHFWATWCPPCVEELPTLDRLNRSMAGKDFALLAISVDEGGAPVVTDFLKKHNISVPVLLDPDHTVSASYGTFKYPETYIVDRTGVVRNKIIGGVDWTRPDAVSLIEDLLKTR